MNTRTSPSSSPERSRRPPAHRDERDRRARGLGAAEEIVLLAAHSATVVSGGGTRVRREKRGATQAASQCSAHRVICSGAGRASPLLGSASVCRYGMVDDREFQAEVGIVGAGPAGLVVALLLQQAQIPCIVPERLSS